MVKSFEITETLQKRDKILKAKRQNPMGAAKTKRESDNNLTKKEHFQDNLEH